MLHQNLYIKRRTIDITPDAEGNTQLHRIMKTADSYQLIFDTISKFDDKSLRKMAGRYNNEGKLPIQLIPDSYEVEDEVDDKFIPYIYQKMLKATPSKAKPLNEMLDGEAVCRKYQVDPQSKLGRNLILGCTAVNEARKVIFDSSTHPNTAKRLDTQQLTELIVEMESDRDLYNEKICRYVLESDDIQFTVYHLSEQEIYILNTKLTDEQRIEIYRIMMSVYLKNERANCHEFGNFISFYLDGIANVKTRGIQNGDHAFNEIDPEDKDNAVSVDAWAGEVSPTYRRDKQSGEYVPYKKLRCYFPYLYQDKWHMFTPRYNPNYQKLFGLFDTSMLDTGLNRNKSDLCAYIYSFIDKLNDKEKFILIYFIVPILERMLKRKQISMDELTQLKKPAKTLIPIFMDTTTRELFTSETETISVLEDEWIKKHNKEKYKNRQAANAAFYKTPIQVNGNNGTGYTSTPTIKRRHTM